MRIKANYLRRFVVTVLVSVILITTSCDGTGMFSTIATQEVTRRGLLPDGLSPDEIFRIDGLENGEDRLIFSSGPALYIRDADGYSPSEVIAKRWKRIPLPEGEDGIQSLIATRNRVYLATYKTPPSTSAQYRLSFFVLDPYIDNAVFLPLGNGQFTSTSSEFHTVKLFYPSSSDDMVYINLMTHTGQYSSLNSDEKELTQSDMYAIDDSVVVDGTPPDFPAAPIWSLDDLSGTGAGIRYVTAAASNNSGTTLFSTCIGRTVSNSGFLVDETGVEVSYGSAVPITGLTWLDDAGAFIMGGTVMEDSKYPVFVSSTTGDGINTWHLLTSGTSSEYQFRSFADISSSVAGAGRVIAGTGSMVLGSSIESARGYYEIDVSNPDSSTWTITTNTANFLFANSNAYAGSDLNGASIDSLTYDTSSPNPADHVLLASTPSLGVWSIGTNESRPSWIRE